MTQLNMSRKHLENILDKAVNGIDLSLQEIMYLLSLEKKDAVEKVMSTARRLRERYFGRQTFLYGFIYFSTYCRNHCAFCYYRKTNELSPRYRKTLAEVGEIALGLAESGVHLIDLTMGEDPETHDTGNFDMIYDMIAAVKEKTGLPVMISPGVVPDEVLRVFRNMSVDWYALYQETHNPVLYSKLRIGQGFAERTAKRELARELGMLVEDGMLLGVGETTSDRAQAILNMKRAGVQQARVMSLVPQPQTPLAGKVAVPRMNEYLSIAVMRLVMPDRLIPASLDVDGIKGLKMRLEAGANVVTSIIPPSSNLAGVSQSTLDIEQGLRTVPEVKKVLKEMGLEAAKSDDSLRWLAVRKEKSSGREVYHAQNRYSGRAAAGAGSCLPGQAGGI